MPKLLLDDFIKAGRDVFGGEILTFMNEGELKESTMYKKPDGTPNIQLVIGVELPGWEIKKISVNKTSMKNLANAFGLDTKNWVGKTAKINVGYTPQGKKMIILEPLTTESIANTVAAL